MKTTITMAVCSIAFFLSLTGCANTATATSSTSAQSAPAPQKSTDSNEVQKRGLPKSFSREEKEAE
jgi:outer membrane lipoprotein SlyB